MEDIIAVFIPIAGMILAFAVVYINRSASNREKLSMLEKGFTPQEIEDAKNSKSKDSWSNGFLFAGVGLGLLVGYLLQYYTEIGSMVAYFAGAFLFGGIGLILAKKFEKEDKE